MRQANRSWRLAVSDVTIAKYVRGVTRENLYPPENPVPAAEPQQDLEPAAEAQRSIESAAEPQPTTTELYEVARGFEIFVKDHIAGDFFISVSRNDGVTIITAAADDEEVTIKRKESTS